MSFTVTCKCGQKLSVPQAFAGKKATCPTCLRTLRVPSALSIAPTAKPAPVEIFPVQSSPQPANSGANKFLLAWGALLLFCLGGLGTLAVVVLTKKDDRQTQNQPATLTPKEPTQPSEPTPSVPSPKSPTTPSPIPPKSNSGDPRNINIPIPPSKPEPGNPTTPPVTKPTPKPTPPASSMKPAKIARVEAGSTDNAPLLRVHLESETPEKPENYEYRTSPTSPWKPVMNGVIPVAQRENAALALEVRNADPNAKKTPILRQDWNGLLRLQWRPPQEGDTFFQQIVVQQNPTFTIAGLAAPANFRYSILSKLTITKVGDKGERFVDQQVLKTQLLQGDQLTGAVIQQGLQRLNGQKFQIVVDAEGKVTQFRSAGNPFAAVAGNFLQGNGFMVASVLDQDGWKELTRATFFVPKQALTTGAKWTEPMTHSWGSLGMWGGNVQYLLGRKQQALQPVDYALNLKYFPPQKGAMGALPLQAQGSRFQIRSAGGRIHFDTTKGRVVNIVERFHARGVLAIQLLGTPTTVGVDEKQVFEVKLFDKLP